LALVFQLPDIRCNGYAARFSDAPVQLWFGRFCPRLASSEVASLMRYALGTEGARFP